MKDCEMQDDERCKFEFNLCLDFELFSFVAFIGLISTLTVESSIVRKIMVYFRLSFAGTK